MPNRFRFMRALPVSAALLISCLVGPAAAHMSTGDTQGPQPSIEAQVLQQMNAQRTARRLPALRRLAVLNRPARAQSAFMAASGAFQHEGADGAQFWVRLVKAGYPRTRAMAENIAMVSGCDATTAAQIVQLWMESPGHRANLLSRQMRNTGIGVVATDGCEEVYVTADYGG